nr:DNA/RNA helicase domain-containing protein [Lactovum miscens]
MRLIKQDSNIVSKLTKFINSYDPSKPVDIVIIDEAHLLWTQGKQSYRGENQLQDILDRAKVVIVVFDKNQILSREQFVENKDYTNLLEKVKLKENYFYLGEQLRINAEEYTVNWIRELIDNQKINPIRKDSKYDLIIFNDVEEMYERLKAKSKNEEAGISRLLATFDGSISMEKSQKTKNFGK